MPDPAENTTVAPATAPTETVQPATVVPSPAAEPAAAPAKAASPKPPASGGRRLLAAFDQFKEASEKGAELTPEEATRKIEESFTRKTADEPKKEEPTGEKEVPAEAADEDFPDPPGLNEKAFSKFRDLRKMLYAERDARKSAETRLAALEKAGKDTTVAEAKLKQLEQSVEEYERQLGVVRVEGTREFRRAVREPLAAIYNTLDSLARKYEVDVNRLVDAIEETDEAVQDTKFQELLEPFSDRDRTRIYTAADDTRVVLSRRAEMLAQARERAAELEAAEKADAAREAAKAREARLDLSGRVLEMVARKVPGLSEDTVAEIRNEVRESDFADLATETQAYSVVAAATLPRVVARLAKAEAELEKANETIRRISAAGPSGSTTDQATAPSQRKGFLKSVFEGG